MKDGAAKLQRRERRQALRRFKPAASGMGLGLGLAVFSTALLAQDTNVGGRAWSIVPSFNVATTFVNLRGDQADASRLGSEVITQAGPGLLISSRGGALRGSLDYSVVGTAHSRRTDLNDVSNALTANGQLEAVPGWAYVDLRANISQQAASPFGLQPTAGVSTSNENQREVANITVSPYLRGELAGLASYEIRFSGNRVNARGSSESDSTNLLTSVRVQSRPGPRLGWGTTASSQRIAFRAGRDGEIIRLIVDGSYRVDADLLLTLRGGAETANVSTPFRETYTNTGAGLRWTPSPRTTVSLDVDKRYFGNSHQLYIEHRQRRAAVRFSSTRGANSGSDALGVGTPVTLFQLYMLQFASAEPDAGLRELRVRELLRLTNQNPNTLVVGGFATSSVTLQRRDDLALSYIGVRSSVTLLGYVSSTEAADRGGNTSITGRVRQSGGSLSASHRFTPLTSLTLTGNLQRSLDPLPAQPTSVQRSLSLGLTTALSPSATFSLTARESEFDGQPFPFRETAVSGSLSLRF